MALIFKVGEHHQMPPVPDNFPMCGNYFPESSAPAKPDTCQSNSLVVNALRKIFPEVLESAECSSAAAASREVTWATLITVIVLLALIT